MSLRFFLILTAGCAVLATAGKYIRARWLHLAFKPVTMALIVALALTRAAAARGAYGFLILAGLAAGLAGDVLLMLPADRLRAGMGAFAAGNVLYVLAFAWGPVRLSAAVAAALAAYGLALLLILRPGLGKMRWPVLIYTAVLLGMVWLAAGRRLALTDGRSLLGLVGVCLFLFSDSMNGIKRFRARFRLAEVLILPPYFAAQLLLALSI